MLGKHVYYRSDRGVPLNQALNQALRIGDRVSCGYRSIREAGGGSQKSFPCRWLIEKYRIPVNAASMI